MKVKSYEAAVRKAVFSLLGDNLDDAAQLYVDEVKRRISIQGPPRSVPGQPPHMDTQELHNTFDHVTDKGQLQAFAGSELPYAPILELNMDRPYIRSTLLDKADEIAREMTKP